jgi:UDPglucose 6-dehydrogenase
MKITVIGVGYVGLVVAVCLAELGNDVVGVDVSKEKISALKDGKVPIYEPGLEEMLHRNQKESRIRFTNDMEQAISHGEVIFIAVGTPMGGDSRADLSTVLHVAGQIGAHMNGYKVIVNKSTVPVGTGDKVAETITRSQKSPIEFDVVSNPEFLREGEAVQDFLIPDRVVIGVANGKARKVMEDVYKGIARTDRPIMFTDVKSAELIKYASNAMLATRISFMNELSRLCEKVGGDIKEVAKGMGLDKRIGPRFLQAGAGYGGSCFPKDVQALIMTLKDKGIDASLLEAVEKVNTEQKKSITLKLRTLMPELKGKTIALWGLAFKPKTDDMREAPSLTIANELQKQGAKIRAFDPVAEENASKLLKYVEYTPTPYDAAKDADALIVVTEWNEFRNLDMRKVKESMKHPILIDGRNVYEPADMKSLGFYYQGVGR